MVRYSGYKVLSVFRICIRAPICGIWHSSYFPDCESKSGSVFGIATVDNSGFVFYFSVRKYCLPDRNTDVYGLKIMYSNGFQGGLKEDTSNMCRQEWSIRTMYPSLSQSVTTHQKHHRLKACMHTVTAPSFGTWLSDSS